MYLKKLYKQNKFWFAVAVLFASGQVFINYKNGLMCSPFYNYDMYSNVTLPQQEYYVVQIRIDSTLLQTKNFSPNEWDNLVQPVVFFGKRKSWNSYIFHTETQKFLPVQDSVPYLQPVADSVFRSWYSKQVLRIAHSAAKPHIIHVTVDTFRLAQKYLSMP